MSNNDLRAKQRAAAQEYYEEQEARAEKRAKSRKRVSLIVVFAMIASVGAPAVLYLVSLFQ